MRKFIFWFHLVCGLLCGGVIGIMSFSGIVIAFESEILDYLDRELTKVEPLESASILSAEDLVEKSKTDFPEFSVNFIEISKDPTQAIRLQNRQRESLYANPYTGDIQVSKSSKAHDFLHTFEDWHRWLGMAGEHRKWGKLINGIANLVFLLLCITGFYLWFPKRWKWRLFKQNLLFNKKARKSARDLNWHNVIGFWNLPVLIVLVGTAVVFSFGWAHDLVFRVFGEAPPKHRDFRMMMIKPPVIEAGEFSDADRLAISEIIQSVETAIPDYTSVGIRLQTATAESDEIQNTIQPISLFVYRPALFSTMGLVPVELHPYTGEVLQQTHWSDRSPGLRARVWARFLHTGEAFGIFGKIIASIATAASLVLIYTGFVLSFRRFKKMAVSR